MITRSDSTKTQCPAKHICGFPNFNFADFKEIVCKVEKDMHIIYK